MKTLKICLVTAVLGSMAMLGWASPDAPKDMQSHSGKNSKAFVQNSTALPYGARVVKTHFGISFGFGPGYYGSPYYDDDYYYGPYYRGYYYGHHWRRYHRWHHWHDWY